MTDFYDDSILDLDAQLRQLAQYLIANDLYENTILVLYTDHGQQYTMVDRVPLLMRFPRGQHAGAIYASTQNLDIAPTLLDPLASARRIGWAAARCCPRRTAAG
jgi:arylsulfatase A-like enzyme